MGNYESKYYDLLNRLRKAKEDDSVNDDRYCCVIDNIVPELKESKDEKIRKVIYGWIYTKPSQFFDSGFSKEEMLAWLEKQGEFKNIDSDDLATLETWEDAIKENKEKWQLSDWFVEATSLLIQKVKRIENNENINIKGSRVMLNACVNALKTVGHSHLSDWLKKQGDQNLPIEKLPFEMKTVSESLGFTTQKECDDYNKMVTDLIMSDDGKGEQKPANKVEPKFKVGDNIEPIDSCLGSPLTIYKICDGFYKTNQGTLDFEFENNWRLVEQKSAWTEDRSKELSLSLQIQAYLNTASDELYAKGKPLYSEERIEDIHKCMLMWQKLHNAYFYQKPAWSEEDENVLEDIEEAIINYWHGDTQDILLDFLKSLKDRVQPKQEWNEEDSLMIDEILYFVQEFKRSDRCKNESDLQNAVTCERFLKSLRPQNRWKPSDEHYGLEEFAKIVRCNLTGISKAVQEQFEAKYLQLTGNKMYGGFKD